MRTKKKRIRKNQHLPPKFEIIEHTADIGLRSFGRTLPELFCHAAEGMFSLIGIGRRGVRLRRDRKPVLVTAHDQAELLVAFLGELLSLADAGEAMLSGLQLKTVTRHRCEAIAAFTPKTERAFDFYQEIKAVTYHRVNIRKTKTGWQAEVYFDL